MITTLYAGLLAIFFLFLSAYVIQGRYKYQVGIGNGANPALARRVRIHGNFVEYVPLALLLLYLVDNAQTSPFIVHMLGMMLLLGRALHAWGLSTSEGVSFGRFSGMILTLVMIAACAVLLLWNFLALRLTGF